MELLPEEPEPPEEPEYKVKLEWFNRKLKMFVVREKSNNKFVTALSSKDLALGWVNKESKRHRKRRRS
tara:strand:+ start:34 stop:237 length:204 start_codon:yes stop_codon:yes gene_type:complete